MTSRIPPLAIHPWGRYWLARALLALLTLPTLAHAVACGDVLVGGSHTLTADLDCSALESFALVLRDGAVLDLAGHTVMASAPGRIILDGTGSTLMNGQLVGADTSVEVTGVGGHTVDGITILNEVFFAFHVVSDNNLLRHLAGQALATYVIEGDRNMLRQSTSAFADRTIHVYGQKNVIDQNTADHQAGGLFVPGHRNVLTRNTLAATGGGIEGILVQGQGNVIARNTATGFDLDAVDASGNCTTNRWRKNTFATADPACILSTVAPKIEAPLTQVTRPRPDYAALCAAAQRFYGDDGPRFARCDR